MAASKEQLQELAELKVQLRLTDAEIATRFGVTQRTIQRWLHESSYATVIEEFKANRRDEARQRISALADDVITNMVSLMTSARSDFVRVTAAKTLGEWLGLHQLEEKHENDDDRQEALELLRMIATRDQASPPLLILPPRPGGALPITPDVVEASIVDDPTIE